jgi:hypothetical protein
MHFWSVVKILHMLPLTCYQIVLVSKILAWNQLYLLNYVLVVVSCIVFGGCYSVSGFMTIMCVNYFILLLLSCVNHIFVIYVQILIILGNLFIIIKSLQ